MTRTAHHGSFLLSLLLVSLCAPLGWSQGPAGQPPFGQQAQGQPAVVGQGAGVAVQPQAPAWVRQLTPEHQKWVDDVLAYWEHSSAQIKRYRCDFMRFEYDPIFAPPDIYKTWSEGKIQYQASDKGMYRVDSVMHIVLPLPKDGSKPEYEDRSEQLREHWICDGASIFEFDYQQKQLRQYRLAPELRGQGIVDSPLPFLFGVKKDRLKQRYWIRNITPTGTKGEYHLEVWPKFAQDARNYKKVHVIIAQEDYLPNGIVIFPTVFDERKNPSRTSFKFTNREKDFNILAQELNIFHREFFEPATPRDWKKVVENFGAPAEPPRVPAAQLRAAGVPQQAR